jgi:hypothetical protein
MEPSKLTRAAKPCYVLYRLGFVSLVEGVLQAKEEKGKERDDDVERSYITLKNVCTSVQRRHAWRQRKGERERDIYFNGAISICILRKRNHMQIQIHAFRKGCHVFQLLFFTVHFLRCALLDTSCPFFEINRN